MSDFDIYWLRRKVCDKVPEEYYQRFGIPIDRESPLRDGVQLVLDILSDLTFVNFHLPLDH